LYAGRATALAGVPGAELVPGENVDILMVEDNKDDIDLTLRAFKQARILNSIQVAHDGEEALDFLFGTGRFAQTKRRLRPQLVLLDLHLPRVPGLEVMRRMMADERTRHIPVVVLTASRDAEELAECQRLGAKTFMVKPVDFQGLSQVTPPLHLDWMLLKSPVTSARPAGA
jgi:CheY-like chemotaxis protein